MRISPVAVIGWKLPGLAVRSPCRGPFRPLVGRCGACHYRSRGRRKPCVLRNDRLAWPLEVVLDGSDEFAVHYILGPAIVSRKQAADAQCLGSGFLWWHRRDGLACGSERS
jgi:hypothetical protein